MAQWKVFNPDHEVTGQVLLDFANAVGGEEIVTYFERHGLTNIDPKAWYSMQTYLDVLSDIANTRRGGMFDFVSIGMKQAENVIVPPEFESLPLLTILQGSNNVLKLNNRGTDFGDIKCEVVSDKHVKLILRVPQPDDLWYGIYYGYVRRFRPKGSEFTVAYDPSALRKDTGGDTTILHITWN